MSERNSLSAPLASFARFRSLISGMETSNTDISAQDSQSMATVDQISTARASVAILDKLWTQIDVLDDVKAMAEEVDRAGGFFNEEFSNSLDQLKHSQSRLLDVISKHQAQSDAAREQRREQAREHSEVVGVDEDGISSYQEQTRKRMSEFFAGPAEPIENAQLRDFDELNEYVLEVRRGLGEVSEKMTQFDEITKKLW